MKEENTFYKILYKQAFPIILLVFSNIFLYQYFTNQLEKQRVYFTVEVDKRDIKIDKLETKLEALNFQLLTTKK